MKARLTDEEKGFLDDALSRIREADRLIDRGKAMKDEARAPNVTNHKPACIL